MTKGVVAMTALGGNNMEKIGGDQKTGFLGVAVLGHV